MKHTFFFLLLLVSFVSLLQAQVGNPVRTDYIWWGTVSNDWNEGENWSTFAAPGTTSDVIINSGCPNYPYVNTADAFCNTVLLQAGAFLTVGGYNLSVTDSVHIYGQLNMNNTGEFIVNGDLFWESGSTAAISHTEAVITCHGDMRFNAGSDVQFDMGEVQIGHASSLLRYLYNYSPNTEFNDLTTYGNGFSIYSPQYDFTVNGDLTCIYNSWLACQSSYHNIYLKGDIIDYNTTFDGIKLYTGTLVLNGGVQHLTFSEVSVLSNLTIQVSNYAYLNSNMQLRGDLTIESGFLYAFDNTIGLWGDWSNTIGAVYFNEGTSTVVFNGSSNQYCSYSENFYNLELNKSADSLILNSSTAEVHCESYDWTSGTLTVMDGTFEAESLADNGIAGSWHLVDGDIYLRNPSGRIDLNGDVIVEDGYFIVSGGTEPSYWPYNHDASLTVTGGWFGITEQDVNIQNHVTYTLDLNLTGGSLGFGRDLTCTRTDFNSEGTAVYFTGSGNSEISMVQGSSFSTVRISKSLDATATAITDLDLNGSFYIDNGYFAAPDTMRIAGSFHAGSSFIAGTGTVIFDGSTNQTIYYSPSFYNLVINKPSWSSSYVYIYSSSSDVVCENYIWNSGIVRVSDDGTFTANNLPQNCIKGNWRLYGGTINLHQPSGRNDLDGSIKIYGGEFNIYGSTGLPTTYWCYNADAEVYIDSGTLNYANQGIYIYDNPSHTLTTDFTGGTLKINGSLLCDRTDFNPSGTVFEIEGPNNATIDIFAGSNLSNVIINKDTAANTVSAFFDLVINGDFIIQNGTVTAPDTMRVSGNWDNQLGSSYFDEGAGTVILCGSDSTTCNEEDLCNLEIDKQDGTVTYGNALSLAGYLTIDSGRLDCNGFDLTCDGDITVNGTLELDEGVTLTMQSGMHLTVNDGGRLEAIGTGSDQVTLTNSTGYTNYEIESGGEVAAIYAIFEKPTRFGFYIRAGALVDTQYSLEKCTFREGTTDGALLRIENDQNFSVKQAIFPTNTWGGPYNVMKTSDSGLVCFVNCTGDFAGEAYDADSHDRLLWLNNPTPATPDLRIVRAEWSEDTPAVGDTVYLKVNWLNVSTTRILMTEFNLSLYYNLTNPPILQIMPSQNVTFQYAPAGDLRETVFEVIRTGITDWNSWLWIDRGNAVTEADEDNNIYGPFVLGLLYLPAVENLTINPHPTLSNTVLLEWTYPNTCDRFNVYRGTDPYFTPEAGNLTGSVSYPETSWTENTGDKYFYIIKAETD